VKSTFAALIPNYNDSAHIAHALRGALAQTVPYDEIVIIDDGSTDDSVKIIESLIAGVPQARLYRNEKNMGVLVTLDRGFALATSDFVHMMSANDCYFPCIVECAQRLLARFPDAVMISGNAGLTEAATGKPQASLIVRLPQEEAFVTPQEYAARNCRSPVAFSAGANIIRRDAYFAFGGLDADLAWHADWFLYFSIGLSRGFAYTPTPYATHRLEGERNYSSGRFDWRRDKVRLAHLLTVLRERYPTRAAQFKAAAIFPHYSLRILALALEQPHRWFITPLFVWRCVGHQCTFWMKTILPRRWLMAARALFRL
jgi:glycosyltransferase involved in cell wall biosynthesis